MGHRPANLAFGPYALLALLALMGAMVASPALAASKYDSLTTGSPEYREWRENRRRDHDVAADQAAWFDRPATLSVELGGRAAAYDFAFDQLVSDSVALGAAFSYGTWGFFDRMTESYVFPLYANYYFKTRRHRPFVTAGIDLLHFGEGFAGQAYFGRALGSISPSLAILGTAGAGYEFRGTGGFLFRLAAYALFGNGGAVPSAGLSIGYAF
jgi:hypothetical protein